MKKILLLSQYYYPDNISTAILPYELATEIAARGEYIVEVLCGYPKEYTTEVVPEIEYKNNHKIKRLNYNAENRKSIKGRIINYFSFFIAIWKAKNDLKEYDLILTHSTPPINPFIPALFKKKFKYKLVYIVYDLYPDIAEKFKYIKKQGLVSKIFRRMNTFVFNKCDAIVLLSQDMKEYFINHYGYSKKAHVIHNWYENLGFNSKQDLTSKNKVMNIVYGGNAGVAQDIATILDFCEEMKADNIHVNFVAQGKKTEEIVDRIERSNLTNTTFYEYMNKEDYDAFLDKMDFAIISMEKEVLGLASPSKAYSYLAKGLPIIFIGPTEMEISNLIAHHNAGIVVQNHDHQKLAERIRSITPVELLNYSNNSRELYEKSFTKELSTAKYIELIDSIMEETNGLC